MADEQHRPPVQWWQTQVERRLDDLSKSLAEMTRELREEVRRNDIRGGQLQNMEERVRGVQVDLQELQRMVRGAVSREDFKPYRNGIIAVITAIALAVLGAVLKLVIVPH